MIQNPRNASAFFVCLVLVVASLPQETRAAEDITIADFEASDYGDWKTEGTAFGSGPAEGRLDRQGTPTRFEGKRLANSYHGYEQGTGKLTSPPFTIERKCVNFLIGGGGFPGRTGINLLLDGKPVRTATAPHRKNRLGHEQHYEILFWHHWDVGDLIGKEVVVEIFDHHTGGMGHILVDHIYQSDTVREPDPPALLERTMLITKNYVNIPTLRHSPHIMPMHMEVDGRFVFLLNMRMAPKEPDLWMPMDARRFKGKEIRFTVEPYALPGNGGLRMLYQSDEIVHAEGLYDEALRPQFHYSQRTGWNNDPNGMVYYDGEYHLFSQHDPHNWIGANGFWGHAVSRDLVHWEELPLALYPYPVARQHCYSGSAIVDESNVAGFQTGSEKTILAFFTDTGCGESIAYSNDRGRTFTYYENNPVLRHPGRDPKVIWYEPGKHWVMAVYDDTPAIGPNTAFYSSKNLKDWKHESNLRGYFECPELYELPVLDAKGNPTETTKWVTTAADGAYAVGSFDGKAFRPEHQGKHRVFYGAYYAAQTFSQTPDARRIQIAWARIDMPDMPFNQTFTFPHRLTLRQTPAGVRLFAEPVKEIESLYAKRHSVSNKGLTEKSPVELNVGGGLFDICATFELRDAAKVGLAFGGEEVSYDVKAGRLGEAPLSPIDGRVSIRVLVDRPMLEICGNDGRVYITRRRTGPGPQAIPVVRAFAAGGNATLVRLEVIELKSIWEK
jgi:fructan beta-fructosidase